MAKYQTTAFTNRSPVPQPSSAAVTTVVVDVAFPSTAFVANDLVELVEIPAGVQLVDYAFVFPDIDSNVSPALAFSFGSENSTFDDLGTVYEASLTAGQSAAVVRMGTSAAAQASKTAARRLALKITTAAGTYAGAGKTGQVLLSLRG